MACLKLSAGVAMLGQEEFLYMSIELTTHHPNFLLDI